MTKTELRAAVEKTKTETKEAVECLLAELNHGQRQILLRRSSVRSLCERYGVDTDE